MTSRYVLLVVVEMFCSARLRHGCNSIVGTSDRIYVIDDLRRLPLYFQRKQTKELRDNGSNELSYSDVE